jgi:hypothetical protein
MIFLAADLVPRVLPKLGSPGYVWFWPTIILLLCGMIALIFFYEPGSASKNDGHK